MMLFLPMIDSERTQQSILAEYRRRREQAEHTFTWRLHDLHVERQYRAADDYRDMLEKLHDEGLEWPQFAAYG